METFDRLANGARAAVGNSWWEWASEREQPEKAEAFPGCSTDRYTIGLLFRLSYLGVQAFRR